MKSYHWNGTYFHEKNFCWQNEDIFSPLWKVSWLMTCPTNWWPKGQLRNVIGSKRRKKEVFLSFFFHPSSFFDDDGRHFRVLRLFGNTLATLLDLSVKKIFFFGFHSSTFSISKVVKRLEFSKKSKANWDCCLFIIFFGEAKWQNWGTYCTKTIYIKMQILVVNHYFYEFHVKPSWFSN